jgi:Fur family transcriptional regulator, ferric uptake regulator
MSVKRRNTKSKQSVIEVMTAKGTAMSHAEIYEKLVGVCDRVTVYRILDRMVEDDEIHKIADTDGSVKFALCHHHDENESHHHSHSHSHVHFKCQNCLDITCLEDVLPVYQLPDKYQAKEVSFSIAGICPKCQ